MTGDIMDKVLGKYEVKQFNPLGEKFNANEQEAIYAI
jgi:molecular chaperone GrpE (heat shock protein)